MLQAHSIAWRYVRTIYGIFFDWACDITAQITPAQKKVCLLKFDRDKQLLSASNVHYEFFNKF